MKVFSVEMENFLDSRNILKLRTRNPKLETISAYRLTQWQIY